MISKTLYQNLFSKVLKDLYMFIYTFTYLIHSKYSFLAT